MVRGTSLVRGNKVQGELGEGNKVRRTGYGETRLARGSKVRGNKIGKREQGW